MPSSPLKENVNKENIDDKKTSIPPTLRLRLSANTKSMAQFRPQTDLIKSPQNYASERIHMAAQTDKVISQSAVGSFYGLPSKVEEILRLRRGISTLYDWQIQALSLHSVRSGGNLIISLPTSGGKTLMAELWTLRQVLCHQKSVIIVLPFVAIVKEKVDSLTEFSVELDFRVEEYAGGRGMLPPVIRRPRSVYICTIEKANSLFDSFVENGRTAEVGLVVIDEMHMVGGTGTRGALLEGLMTKVIFSSHKIQMIGMSSTLAKIDNLKFFMSADYFSSSFRPVELKQFVKLKNAVYQLSPSNEETKFELSRTLNYPYTKDMEEVDCDHLAGLVSEVVPHKSCLIFCPTRKNCENIALMLCKLMPKNFRRLKVSGKTSLLQDLEDESSGSLCSVLRQTVVYGVAYHHGGLTNEERKLLELAFTSRIVVVMCCTSTLAAGVNLPAQRVIIRSPYVGAELLSPAQYRQMSGRAGRAGLDDVGESYLVIRDDQRDVAMTLMGGTCADDESCCSSCLLQSDGRFVINLVLSVIGIGLVTSLGDLYSFAQKTLAYQQFKEETDKLFSESVDWLIDNKLVARGEDSLLGVTSLGKAVCKGSVDIHHCRELYRDLEFGLSGGLVLYTHFHLITLVTPYDLQVRPDFRILLSHVERLKTGELMVMNRMGISEDYVTLRAGNKRVNEKVSDQALSRFYLSLMLNSLCNQKGIAEVAGMFQVNRGFVQNLVNSAGSFASNLIHFVEELDEFWAYKLILPPFVSRLCCSMRSELAPLLSLPYVSQIRAKQMFQAGFKTLQIIAYSEPRDLVSRVPNVSGGVAWRIIKAAMQSISDQAEQLMEEAKQVIARPVE